jgi:hypothetical protein
VEYYYPYTAAGEQRELTFNWTADFSVERFIVSVQQPFSSANLTTNPAAYGVATSHVDGLTYHVLPTIAVPAGQAYEVAVNYEMTSPLLTAARLANQTEPAETEGISAVVPTSLPNWALYLAAAGIALVGVALFWQAYNQRQKTHQPAQRRGATKAEYCHQCGQRRQKGDQFCRDCGAHLK